MLEGVSVDVAFAQRFVRQNVVVKGYQLNVQAILLFCDFLRYFCNLLLSANNDAHFDMVWIFFILTATHQSQGADQCAYRSKGLQFKRHVISLIRRVCVV
ncbi:hypothetical protein D3C72_793850 [compost metagenome]